MGRTLGTRDGDVAPENAARAAALKNCRAKIKDRFTIEERRPCIEYAEKAKYHASRNVEFRCGAKQALRWSNSEREHFEACIFVGEAGKAFLAEEARIREKGIEACREGFLLSDDGHNTGRKGKATLPIITGTPVKLKPRTYSGGDTTSTNPGTGKSKGSSASTSGGGCGGSAMDRLGGGCGPSGGAVGGDNLSHSGGTPGSKSKPNTGAGTSSGGSGAIGGGPSGGETKAYQGGTPVAAPKPEKRFGRSGNSSVDYGFGPKPAAPKPPYVR
jgi:hypothetical protein